MSFGKLSSQRILITGGNGFVGRQLKALLAKERPGWEVLSFGGPEDKVGRCLNVEDLEAVRKVISESNLTQVVHLAAISAVQASMTDPERAWRTNLGGTLNIVRSIQTEASSCRLLFISSAEVYGRSFISGVPADEMTLLMPTNPYAASKAAADILVQQVGWSGLQTCVLRPFNHTGVGQGSAFAIPSFAAQIVAIERGNAEAIIRVGSLDDERDFLDVSDVLTAYILMLDHPEWERAACYNVASGFSFRIGDLLETLLGMSKSKVRVEVDPSRIRPGGVSRILGDASKLRTLGWEPRAPITSTLSDILASARAASP